MGPDDRSGYPSIDFSRPENRHYDWLSVAEMIEGTREPNAQALSSINIKVVTQMRQFDCLSFNAHLLVSDSAKAILESLAPGDCQFTSLHVNERPFSLLLPTKILNVLDRPKSELVFLPNNPNLVMRITRYRFQKRVIPDPSLFRIPENKIRVFVTDTVERVVRNSGLVGFQFIDFENPPPNVQVS